MHSTPEVSAARDHGGRDDWLTKRSSTTKRGVAGLAGAWELCRRGCQSYGQEEGVGKSAARGQIW